MHRGHSSAGHKPAQACRAPQEAHCRHADTTDTRRTRPDSTGCGWTPRPLPWPGGSFLCRGTSHLPEWWLSHPTVPQATADTRGQDSRQEVRMEQTSKNGLRQPSSRKPVLQSLSGLGGARQLHSDNTDDV